MSKPGRRLTSRERSAASEIATAKTEICVEPGEWTAVPRRIPASLTFDIRDIYSASPNYYPTWRPSNKMAFHIIGCSGNDKDPVPQQQVADAMAAQIANPGTPPGAKSNSKPVPPGWMYHLGDITYTYPEGPKQKDLYNALFYKPYTEYKLPIVAIPGNHDCKSVSTPALKHYLRNLCAAKATAKTDNETDQRPAMTQPYPYFVLETPVANIIGLNTNLQNGGVLDDPAEYNGKSIRNYAAGPQYKWLVRQLRTYGVMGLPLLLALHYPPYSYAANFPQRADPNVTPRLQVNKPTPTVLPIGMILQQAFIESRVYPDAVFSAHAHLYERLTYTTAKGRQIPYLIVGSCGHSPVEQLAEDCAGDPGVDMPPSEVLRPVVKLLELPKSDSLSLANYNDRDFGFLRVTVDLTASTLIGEFFTVNFERAKSAHGTYPDQSTVAPAYPLLYDSFTLDLTSHCLAQS